MISSEKEEKRMFSVILDIPKDVEIQRHLTALHIDEWLKEDLFHFRWWLLIFLIIVIFIVWWIMLDKSRLLEICLYAALATILFMGVQEYGEELTLWEDLNDVIPIFPPLSSINLICLPLIFSLVYQHYKKRDSFILAAIIASAAICFIIEPLLTLGGYYVLLKWQYYYSFPLYAAVAIGVRLIVIKIFAVTRESKREQL